MEMDLLLMEESLYPLGSLNQRNSGVVQGFFHQLRQPHERCLIRGFPEVRLVTWSWEELGGAGHLQKQ